MAAEPDFRARPATSGASSAHPLVDVAAGLIFRGGKLLITQRYAGAHLGGLWEFPGGKREAEETFESCLQRELREELGLGVDVGEVIDTLTHRYPEKTIFIRFFRCQCLRGEPQALGCPAFQWVTRDELALYQFPPADARLLDILRRRDDLWRD